MSDAHSRECEFGMVLEKQLISADMFLEYVDQIDDRLVELVEGVIVDISRPVGNTARY